MSVRKPTGPSFTKARPFSYNVLILAQHSWSWLLSRLQGTLPRQSLGLEGSFCQQVQDSRKSPSSRVLLAEAAAAAGLRAAHAWVVWTVSVLLFLLLFLLPFPFRILLFFLFLLLVIRIRWCFWGNRILGTALFVLVLILLLGRLNMHQATLLW